MKILNISKQDYANFQYDNMKALQSVGVECHSVVFESHPFYKEQTPLIPNMELPILWEMINGYDIIQVFHDNSWLCKEIIDRHHKVIVYHTSSDYRKNYAVKNEITKGAYKHIACMPEFVAMCPGSIYMVGAIDTDKVKTQGFDSVYKFAHFPSNSKVKGSQTIFDVLTESQVDFSYNPDLVSHELQLSRIDDCEIYIEMCTEKDGLGSNYGNFGITALEAAALGKIVITQCKDVDVYTSAYGILPFDLITDKDKLRRSVLQWSNYNGEHLKGQQNATREWVVKNHSYKATGEYFLKHVL